MTIAETYARYISSGTFEDLPPHVVQDARKRILDLVGVAIAGCGLDFPVMAAGLMLDAGGRAQSTVIGHQQKLPMASAAFVNAVYAHSLDLDDGHRFSGFHPGVCAIPAALAVGEPTGATGADVIQAVVAGYEVSLRVGKSINPSHLKRGFHTTGTAGIFGAVAAAARLLRLTQQQTANAIAIAAHGASGLMQFTMAKPLNPAHAVHQGILSARLAQQGAVGSRDIFEGKNGFLGAFSDSADIKSMTSQLGERFDMLVTLTKQHACCRHAHTPIDAALTLCAEQGIRPEDIESIHVRTYPVATQVCKLNLTKDPNEARFSLPISLALGIRYGQAGPDVFVKDRVDDPLVQELASKIDISISSEWEEKFADQYRGVTLTITTISGKEFTRSQPLAKGEAELPLSDEEVFKKFDSNAQFLFSPRTSQRLLDVIMALEQHPITDLTALLATPDNQ